MEEDGDEVRSRRCKGLVTFLCGRVGLLMLVSSYALFGAILFKTIEGGDNGEHVEEIKQSREDCLRELWLITERLNVLYEKNWTRLVTEQLKRFERAVLDSYRTEGPSLTPNPHWTFGGALLYTITLLTTVGYGRLSPRTTLGKIAAMLYAFIGVPLMLILLSTLGSCLAGGARKGYYKLTCQSQRDARKSNSAVGYHRAPSSPSGRHLCRAHNEDVTAIQLMPTQYTHNNINHKGVMHHVYNDQEMPKRALLATVRSSHARGRCVQGQVRQMIAESVNCPSHSHGSPSKGMPGCPISLSDVEDADDNDDNERSGCSHHTPSRVPLIWRPPVDSHQCSASPSAEQQIPSVPSLLVFVFFVAYVCAGAAAFSSTNEWAFLDAVYFCFIALSTIGIGDTLPQAADLHTQLQLFACCLYLFVGLILVAMCFSLIQDEAINRCRQFANSIGFSKH